MLFMGENPSEERVTQSRLDKPLTRRDFLNVITNTVALASVGIFAMFGYVIYNFNKIGVETEFDALKPLLKNIAANIKMLRTSSLNEASPIAIQKVTEDFDALVTSLHGTITEARTDETKQKLLLNNLKRISERARHLEKRVLKLFKKGQLES